MLNIGIPKINEFFIGGMLSNEAQVWPNKQSKDFQAISTACCSPDWNVTMFENKLLKVQKEISENANFSLIALKAKAPPSLETPSKATPTERTYTQRAEYQRPHYYNRLHQRLC